MYHPRSCPVNYYSICCHCCVLNAWLTAVHCASTCCFSSCTSVMWYVVVTWLSESLRKVYIIICVWDCSAFIFVFCCPPKHADVFEGLCDVHIVVHVVRFRWIFANTSSCWYKGHKHALAGPTGIKTCCAFIGQTKIGKMTQRGLSRCSHTRFNGQVLLRHWHGTALLNLVYHRGMNQWMIKHPKEGGGVEIIRVRDAVPIKGLQPKACGESRHFCCRFKTSHTSAWSSSFSS